MKFNISFTVVSNRLGEDEEKVLTNLKKHIRAFFDKNDPNADVYNFNVKEDKGLMGLLK